MDRLLGFRSLERRSTADAIFGEILQVMLNYLTLSDLGQPAEVIWATNDEGSANLGIHHFGVGEVHILFSRYW